MSNSLSRSELVRKYFIKSPIKPVEPDLSKYKSNMSVGAGLLLLALLFLLSQQGILILLGVISGVVGFNLLSSGLSESSKQKERYGSALLQYAQDYDLAEPKPSDEQMDEWMNSDIQKIVNEALRRLGIDSDDYTAEPLLIGGPSSLSETRFAKGKDGKTRYSHFNLLVVFLTEYHVAAYQCDCSLEYGQVLTDQTREFPYQEITSLGTQVVKEKIRLLNDLVESESGMQEFMLATSGGNTIKVAYEFANNAGSQEELVRIGGESTISAIRKKLKDYKKKYER